MTNPAILKIAMEQFAVDLYLPEWPNALCKERRQLDVFGVGAYEDGRLVGLAGATARFEKARE